MTYEEFTRATSAPIDAETYHSIVERVYMWHPAIPDANGKQVIADLWKIGGLSLMQELLPRAEHAAAHDEELRRKTAQLARTVENMGKSCEAIGRAHSQAAEALRDADYKTLQGCAMYLAEMQESYNALIAERQEIERQIAELKKEDL